MNFLIVIPARGGSKGIPKKNIKPLNNKPLIHYTIEVAREIIEDKDICVSTDSPEIVKSIEKIGCSIPFIRPKELATDTASTYDVLLHALNHYEKLNRTYEAIILLQPTSPFRRAQQIKEALELYSSNIDMVASVKETTANPYYLLFEENEQGFLEKSKKSNVTRRQDCPKVWEFNGAIYIINTKSLKSQPMHKFLKIRKYIMDEDTSLDLDSELDWLIAEYLIAKK